MNSDFLKGAIDGLTNFVGALESVIDTFGLFPTLMTSISVGFSLFKNKGFFTFDKDAKSIRLLSTDLSALPKSWGKVSTAIQTYNSNLSKSAGLQNAYVNAISKQDAGLGNYLSNLNGAKASMGGYTKSLVGAKVATLALKAGTLALNAALTMGISLLIDFVISGISKLITAESDLAEKVDEVTSKYQERHRELASLKDDYDVDNESSMINRYGELSKGVDGLGRNVSLTADEFSEYQSIVNQIAEQVPSLVAGFDNSGNALLNYKGNIEQVAAAYQELIHLQNQEILSENRGDIQKNFENTMHQANGYGFFESIGNSLSLSWMWGHDSMEAWDMKHGTVKWFKKLLNAAPDEREGIIEELGAGGLLSGSRRLEVIQALQKAGYKVDSYSDISKEIEKIMKEDPQAIQGIIDNWYAGYKEQIESYKTIATAQLSEAFDVNSAISGLSYTNIGEDLQSIAYQTVNSLDFDFFDKLYESGGDIKQWTKEMLDQLNAIGKYDKTKIESAFDLQTQFNGGEISYGDYIQGLKDTEDVINRLNLKTEAKNTLKTRLGLGDEGVVAEYNALLNKLTDSKNYDFNITKDEAKKFLDGLTAEEFAIAVDVITRMSKDGVEQTTDEIEDAIKQELALVELSVDLDIEVEKTKLESLSSAINESLSGSGLSSNSINAVGSMFEGLRSYDPSKLFERTANGIHLNSNELRKLNNEYNETKLAEVNKELNSLADAYILTREELYKLEVGSEEYNNKASDLSALESQINKAEQLKAQYEGLTSAYQQWQTAEAAGTERNMYESVLSGFNTVEDELSRGWIDDGTIEFLELLKGETVTIVDGNGVKKEVDIATASVKELKQVWNDLDKTIEHTAEGGHKGYSVRDFFTVDEDGNSTSKGVYNFLDAIGHMEEEKFGGIDVVQRDDDGNIIGFNFDLVGGDKVIAEALGISEELVQILVRASEDAGFVVNFDGTYQQLDVLKEKAQLAAESMNETLKADGKKTIDIDMNAKTVEEIQPQIDNIMKTFGKRDGNGKLTGAIDMSINGAEDAITVISTLQSMLDRLERPAYMNIQINQVDKELQEPLRNLQDYRTKIEQLNQAKLRGVDTSELEASIEEAKNNAVNALLEIQKNNPKLAADLEIKGLTKEEIEAKVEAGEITIPATIDIQLEMDEKLGILVDKALLDAGLIKPEEFQKRVDIYLDANVDSKDAEDKVDKAVEKVTGNDDEPSSGKTETKKYGIDVNYNGKTLIYNPNTGKTEIGDKQPITLLGANGRLKYQVGVDVTADDVNTSDVDKKTEEAVNSKNDKTSSGKVKKDVDVEVKTGEVTSDVEEKTEEAVKGESGKTTTVEKEVKLDLSVSEYKDVLQELKDSEREITIDATVKNLDDIVKLADSIESINKNVTLSAEIDGEIKNIKTFAESAEKLSEVDDSISVSITAKADGNVFTNDGLNFGGLTDFAKGAKDLTDVKNNPNVTVTANLLGNLTNNKGVDELADFAKGAKELQGVKSGTVEITANLLGNLTNNKGVDELADFAKGAKELQGVKDASATVTANVLGNLAHWTGSLDDLADFADTAKELQGVKDASATVTANVLGNLTNESVSRLQDFASIVNTVSSQSVDISVKASVDAASINTAMDLLSEVANSGLFKDYSATVTVNYNKGEQQKPDDKDANVNYVLGKQAGVIDKTAKVNYERGKQEPPKNMTAKVTYVESGRSRVNGTANVNGTVFANGTSGKAYKQGNWGTKDSGTALMGELGREIIVRDGKWFTVGDDGAGFYPYKKGDIIFNHKICGIA